MPETLGAWAHADKASMTAINTTAARLGDAYVRFMSKVLPAGSSYVFHSLTESNSQFVNPPCWLLVQNRHKLPDIARVTGAFLSFRSN